MRANCNGDNTIKHLKTPDGPSPPACSPCRLRSPARRAGAGSPRRPGGVRERWQGKAFAEPAAVAAVTAPPLPRPAPPLPPPAPFRLALTTSPPRAARPLRDSRQSRGRFGSSGTFRSRCATAGASGRSGPGTACAAADTKGAKGPARAATDSMAASPRRPSRPARAARHGPRGRAVLTSRAGARGDAGAGPVP